MKFITKFFKSLGLFIFGVISAGLLFYFFMISFVNSSKTVEVPYLINSDIETAKAALEEKGLIPDFIGNGDKVIYTEPDAGVKVKEGHHVIVQMRNLENQKSPDLIGLPTEIAEQFLMEYGLTYEINKIKTYDINKNGIVISVVPAPGKRINSNSIVLNVGLYEGGN
ncbi:PASTA domain-containing protein [Geotoga petraea]|jgi:serine/threonine-protein kinase|uniref:PASTA domain-containing protein n=1 Tax=Geotoga petraea TaxID=28234 RepID=A0A1G6JMU3_9BACT|nr:PASTA domain-containing protein [Geotoga petraea]MDK2945410.1 eukaryotic-like serine/threonine-protein kinase [Geotoga sp.]TGG88267.1 PASTA domain-containing protein [Geotoga petraea]SDC20023.1 PASTA domain-containing protein [Geotoga petraea]